MTGDSFFRLLSFLYPVDDVTFGHSEQDQYAERHPEAASQIVDDKAHREGDDPSQNKLPIHIAGKGTNKRGKNKEKKGIITIIVNIIKIKKVRYQSKDQYLKIIIEKTIL